MTNWTYIGVGSGGDVCGIAGGALYCWGYNFWGGLGLGNQTEYNTPQQVGTMTNWQMVSPGLTGTTCGIAGGNLYCWGFNNEGEVGVGTNGRSGNTFYTTPQQVGTMSNWTTISTGGDEDVCGIAGGVLYCWGSDFSLLVPTQASTMTNWTSFAVGPTTLYGFWGIAGGQLYQYVYGTITQIGALNNWTSVSVSNFAGGSIPICGIAGGSRYCWNGFSSPSQLSSDTSWTSISAGNYYEQQCGIDSGNLYCWTVNNQTPQQVNIP